MKVEEFRSRDIYERGTAKNGNRGILKYYLKAKEPIVVKI